MYSEVLKLKYRKWDFLFMIARNKADARSLALSAAHTFASSQSRSLTSPLALDSGACCHQRASK